MEDIKDGDPDIWRLVRSSWTDLLCGSLWNLNTLDSVCWCFNEWCLEEDGAKRWTLASVPLPCMFDGTINASQSIICVERKKSNPTEMLLQQNAMFNFIAVATWIDQVFTKCKRIGLNKLTSYDRYESWKPHKTHWCFIYQREYNPLFLFLLFRPSAITQKINQPIGWMVDEEILDLDGYGTYGG